MAFAPSDLEFYYLDDRDAPNPSADWAAYRDTLTWQPWGVRTSGTPGNNAEYFSDSYNLVNSQPAYFLRGKYASIGAATGHNLTHDYIVDTTDSLLGGNFPLWQYTWVAVMNQGTDPCYRFGASPGFLPDTDFGVPDSINQSTNYVGLRWMGLIDTATLVGLNSLLASNFPHQASIQQRNSSYVLNGTYNWWDALGSAQASKSIFHGFNNLTNYALNNATHNPWQIAGWIGRSDAANNPSNRSQQHCMDIPAGKTLIGVLCISKDSATDVQGVGSISMEKVTNYSWKYSELRVELDHMVIS